MKVKQKFYDTFHPMIKDGGLLFLILATLLVTISIYSVYALRIYLWPLNKTLLYAVPYAFAWVVIAWIITDKSIVRKPYPYLVIFIALFFEKIYWAIFHFLYPISDYLRTDAIGDALAVGTTRLPIPSIDWFNLLESAQNLFIIVEFVVALILFGTIWYLARPKDFAKLEFLKNKRTILLIIGAILMTVPLWIWRAISYFGGPELIRDLFSNIDMIPWYNLIFSGIPIAIAMVIFGFIIKNIKNPVKIVLYTIIFFTIIIPHIPIEDFMFWSVSSDLLKVFSYFFVYAVLHFLLFLSLLLLSKRKYVEQ